MNDVIVVPVVLITMYLLLRGLWERLRPWALAIGMILVLLLIVHGLGMVAGSGGGGGGPRPSPSASVDQGEKVSEVLKRKKGSIKNARLPKGSPSWEEFSRMTMREIEAGAKRNLPGYRTVLKLLRDKRFDR